MTTKIIDTSAFDMSPKNGYRRPSDGKLTFIYSHRPAGIGIGAGPWEIRQAVWNGSTWDTSLIFSTATYFPGLGGTGFTSDGTEIFTTSHYPLPFNVNPPTTTYNGPVDVWRKELGGSWSLDANFPKPPNDVFFAPFGGITSIPGGGIRMTATGRDASKTDARVYYHDSFEDGFNWSTHVDIRNETSGGNECHYYADGDKHMCVIRKEDEIGPLEGGIYVYVSSQAGIAGTWSNTGELVGAIDRYAAAPTLIRLNDGRIVILFGDRGDVSTPFGDEQQHMSIVVGQFEEVFNDINAWSDRIDVADIFPLVAGGSGYGGLFRTDNSIDSTLQMIWMDSVTITDRDIWQKAIGNLLPTTPSFSQIQVIG